MTSVQLLNCLKQETDIEMRRNSQGKKRKKSYNKSVSIVEASENQYENTKRTDNMDSGSSLEDFHIRKQMRNPPVSSSVSLNERHPSDSAASQISSSMSDRSSVVSSLLFLNRETSRTDESIMTENEYENLRMGTYENITRTGDLKRVSTMEHAEAQNNSNKNPPDSTTGEASAAPCPTTDSMGYLEPKDERESRISAESSSTVNVPRTNEAFYLTPKPKRRIPGSRVSYLALSEPTHLNRKSTISTFEKLKNFFMRKRKPHVAFLDSGMQEVADCDKDFLCVSSMPELTRLLPADELNLDVSESQELCANNRQHESSHRLNTKNDVLLIRKELKRNGKNGAFVLTTLARHPLYPFTLHVLLDDTVFYYPIAKTDQLKFCLEPLGKQFSCLCKLVAHYCKNSLPNKEVCLTSQMVPALPVCDIENVYEDIEQG